MQQLRQRVIASYHLGPLDRDETQRYIEHRLKHVGWNGDPKVEVEAFDAVFAFTSGIPRRINLVCNRLMLSGFLRDAHTLSAQDVEVVAQELKEELGTVSAQGVDDPSLRGMDDDAASGGLTHDGAPIGDMAGDATLEERVARLENTLHVVLQMLRKLVRVIEPVTRQDKHARG
jgi:hypothetical protein